MIERRPILDLISHLVLIIGVAIVAFPVYVAFVASTQTPEQAAMAPISLIPGDQFVKNYTAAIVSGASGNVSVPPVVIARPPSTSVCASTWAFSTTVLV